MNERSWAPFLVCDSCLQPERAVSRLQFDGGSYAASGRSISGRRTDP